MPVVRFKELKLTTSMAHLQAMDRLLHQAHPLLLPANGKLENCQERAWSAASDPQRLIMVAWINEQPFAIADVTLGYPESDAMTISQIVVSEKVRRRQIGSQLIRVCANRAYQRDPYLEHIRAYLLKPNSPAAPFWEALGFYACSPTCYSIHLSQLIGRIQQRPLDSLLI
ncbi:MAG: GNAT family N-acetyltransferase [Myxococcales bacterium]|nr:GNAT family N-acetyltransferase [Myxococcales bacterium]